LILLLVLGVFHEDFIYINIFNLEHMPERMVEPEALLTHTCWHPARLFLEEEVQTLLLRNKGWLP
jgi:hypothetical protein